MKQLVCLCALLPLLSLGAGCNAGEEPESVARAAASALTTDDVDFAPECGGIMSYVNWASFSELDSYLPASVANAVVQRRAVQPFTSIADISSVSGIAQARLEQITGRAYTYDFIDADCAGVYEELAVSYDDRTAILAFVNNADDEELRAALRFEQNTVLPLLVSGRPYSSLQAIANTYGVGPSTFRSLRDAAIESPFDELASRVNAVHRDASISTNFDWFSVMADQPGQPSGMVCFGLAQSLVDSFYGDTRPNLADGDEVMAEVTATVSYADRYDEVGDSAAGLADLAAQVDGQSFFGCYIGFHPDPWSGVNRAFFVNKETGYRVLTETSWSE